MESHDKSNGSTRERRDLRGILANAKCRGRSSWRTSLSLTSSSLNTSHKVHLPVLPVLYSKWVLVSMHVGLHSCPLGSLGAAPRPRRHRRGEAVLFDWCRGHVCSLSPLGTPAPAPPMLEHSCRRRALLVTCCSWHQLDTRYLA